MKKNVLGRTGLEVTELSLGTLILGRIQANLSIEDGAKPVARAMELGINFIDTAASYGSQPHVREGLKGFPGEVLISTKSHGRTREAVQKDFETSLKELGRDYIDVYQLHLVNNAKELEERREVVKFLVELKKQKRIRATKVGGTYIIEETEFERFAAIPRPNGRPPKEPEIALLPTP